MKKWLLKLVGLLGLQLDPMLVAMRTVTTPTRPMAVTSSYNASHVPKKAKAAKRNRNLIRFVDPRHNVVLYISPDTDVDLLLKVVDWTMGIDWEKTLRGMDS